MAALRRGLESAVSATQGAAKNPQALQILAETNLRLARTAKPRSKDAEKYSAAGFAALAQVFAENPDHAAGRATEGALQLLRAESSRSAKDRRESAQAAVTAIERALRIDPLLARDYDPLRKQAQDLVKGEVE